MRALVAEIASCTRCPLHASRKNPVPGEGDLDAELMLVGEAPGRWEDEKGRPFVGAAGKLLNELLALAGFKREEVYIANVLKCRPPGNRDPKPEEVEACTPFLDRQIRIVAPRVIACLGRHSTRYLFSKAGLVFRRMGEARGRIYRARLLGMEVLLIPTFHPASALYNPSYRALLEADFELIGRVVKGATGAEQAPPRRRRRTLEDFMV
ncbi:uracil-DNA glycosylase [Candidatus Bathyarchaeota archaeon]|nr:MAG: uracil-DNA glycosylase [Candidatus Bathyarchaeota archaeon]